MAQIRILIVPPGEVPYPETIPDKLIALQNIVGGDIEVLYPFDDPVGVVCHDFGKFIDLPLNRALRDESGKIYDIIAGTFFIVGLGVDDFESLPEEMLAKYEKLFHNPETFVKINGKLHAIPYDPTTSE